jgi:hypothetical protein
MATGETLSWCDCFWPINSVNQNGIMKMICT